MKTANSVDAARIELLLSDLRLPAIKLMWAKFAEQSDKEGWPAARFLAALAEHEIADRGRRRIERHLAEARLPVGKTIASFDFEAVPMISKAQVMALTAGDSWLEKGANLLLFGPPGGGKSHLAAALGLARADLAKDQRADAERVAHADELGAGHRHDREGTLDHAQRILHPFRDGALHRAGHQVDDAFAV